MPSSELSRLGQRYSWPQLLNCVLQPSCLLWQPITHATFTQHQHPSAPTLSSCTQAARPLCRQAVAAASSTKTRDQATSCAHCTPLAACRQLAFDCRVVSENGAPERPAAPHKAGCDCSSVLKRAHSPHSQQHGQRRQRQRPRGGEQCRGRRSGSVRGLQGAGQCRVQGGQVPEGGCTVHARPEGGPHQLGAIQVGTGALGRGCGGRSSGRACVLAGGAGSCHHRFRSNAFPQVSPEASVPPLTLPPRFARATAPPRHRPLPSPPPAAIGALRCYISARPQRLWRMRRSASACAPTGTRATSGRRRRSRCWTGWTRWVQAWHGTDHSHSHSMVLLAGWLGGSRRGNAGIVAACMGSNCICRMCMQSCGN